MKRNILWIDDKPEEIEGVVELGKDVGIEFEHARTAEEGFKKYKSSLAKWHGVILDGYFWKDSFNKEENERALINFLDSIKGLNRKVPIFIYSGFVTKLNENVAVDEMLKKRGIKCYAKNSSSDQEQLIKDVLLYGTGVFNVQKFINLCPTTDEKKRWEEHFFVVLNVYEEKRWNDDTVFNSIRQLLELLEPLLENIGIHGEKKSLSNLSKHLSKMYNYVVPNYIKEIFRTLLANANAGVHTYDILIEDVKSGKAPFLVESSILELFSILTWFDSLPKDSSDIEKYRRMSQEVIENKQRNDSDIFVKGEIQYNNGNYSAKLNSDYLRPEDAGRNFNTKIKFQ